MALGRSLACCRCFWGEWLGLSEFGVCDSVCKIREHRHEVVEVVVIDVLDAVCTRLGLLVVGHARCSRVVMREGE